MRTLSVKDVERYEDLVFSTVEWNPRLDPRSDLLTKSTNLVDSIKDLSSDIFKYSILLEGYLMIKSGNIKTDRIGKLKRLSREKDKFGLAAKWIFARLKASLASNERITRWGVKESYDLIKDFPLLKKYIEFDLPIILPGIRTESIPEWIGENGDGGDNLDFSDPYTFKISTPHRYIAAYAMNLGAEMIQHNESFEKGINILSNGVWHCEHLKTEYGENSPIQARYVDQLLNSIKATLILYNEDSKNINSIIESHNKFVEKLPLHEKNFEISHKKVYELTAASYAVEAAITKGIDHINALNNLHKYIRLNIEKIGNGFTGHFNIDSIYQMAHKTVEEKEELYRILNTDYKSKNIRFNDSEKDELIKKILNSDDEYRVQLYKGRIINEIAANNLDSALNTLKKLSLLNQENIKSTIMFLRRYNAINESFQLGLISQETLNVESNRICYSIIETLANK